MYFRDFIVAHILLSIVADSFINWITQPNSRGQQWQGRRTRRSSYGKNHFVHEAPNGVYWNSANRDSHTEPINTTRSLKSIKYS